MLSKEKRIKIKSEIKNGRLILDNSLGLNSEAILFIKPNRGYKVPASINDIIVKNCKIKVYNRYTGKLVIYDYGKEIFVSSNCTKNDSLQIKTFDAVNSFVFKKNILLDNEFKENLNQTFLNKYKKLKLDSLTAIYFDIQFNLEKLNMPVTKATIDELIVLKYLITRRTQRNDTKRILFVALVSPFCSFFVSLLTSTLMLLLHK